jgi:hypothetical protein
MLSHLDSLFTQIQLSRQPYFEFFTAIDEHDTVIHTATTWDNNGHATSTIETIRPA